MFLSQLPVRRATGYRWVLRRFFGEAADEAAALFALGKDEDVRAALDRLITVTAFACPARTMARAMESKASPAWPVHTAAEDRHMIFGDAVEAGSGLWHDECDLAVRIQAERRSR